MGEPTALPVPRGVPLRLIPRSDVKLARLAATGDERAFAAIYDRYHQELYRYCRAILHDPDDAHDALQSTMASALRSLPGETREIALRPWLYRVARNEAISLIRRREMVAEEDENAGPSAPGADLEAEARQRLRSLVADLEALPERQRSALVMRELSGLDYEQVAEALETSPGAARQTIYEARVALQELREGRAMECEEVRQAISDRDGRVLRARKIRSHLRTCEGCSDFRRGIETRAADFQLLAPPLSAAAASGVLGGVLGGGSTQVGAGTLGGLFAGMGGLSGGAIGVKTLGVVAATAVLGAGAGAVAGVDLPLSPSGNQDSQARPAGTDGVRPAPPLRPERRSGAASSERGKAAGDRGSRSRGTGKADGRAAPSASQSPAAPAQGADAPADPPAGIGQPPAEDPGPQSQAPVVGAGNGVASGPPASPPENGSGPSGAASAPPPAGAADQAPVAPEPSARAGQGGGSPPPAADIRDRP